MYFAHFFTRHYERRVATKGFALDAQQPTAKHDRTRTATRGGSYARSVEQRARARVAGEHLNSELGVSDAP